MTLKLKSVNDPGQCGQRVNYLSDNITLDNEEKWFLEHFCELHSPVHTRHSPLLDIYVRSSLQTLPIKPKTLLPKNLKTPLSEIDLHAITNP